MKFQIFFDRDREEQVIVYAHQRTELTEKIEQLVLENKSVLSGYRDKEIFPLNISEIYCFTVINNKVFAVTEEERFLLKNRLYELEESINNDFIKINQSCIINIKKIEKFSAAFSGSLQVKLKNGYVDYVSRRNLKSVKERLGL
jgi:DNA-binding LytR/AlgR family response regulator